MNKKPKVVAVVGATASGKSALAIELAKEFSGEIISADSRQVYRGLDVGTGKVTPKEMSDIPHHLLDIVEPTEIYTADAFTRDATHAIKTIVDNQHLPIIAGGTFFYLDILRGKMQASPVEPDQSFRDSLAKYSNEELLELLESKDPKRAANIDSHNRRRLVRALEIINTMGHVPPPQAVDTPYDWLMIGIKVEKEVLLKNFNLRLEDWLARGLLEEVTAVREQLSAERFLELGFEYTLVAEYLDNRLTKAELFEQFVQKNWQYAKRQLTWLKRDEKIVWFQAEEPATIFNQVREFLSN
jgi:tRNA dimethylallyltransferase